MVLLCLNEVMRLKVTNWKQIVEELPPEDGWARHRATGLFILEVESGNRTLIFIAQVVN